MSLAFVRDRSFPLRRMTSFHSKTLGQTSSTSTTSPTRLCRCLPTGLVIDGIFGQANDRIGVGYTWTDPANDDLDDQSQIDTYYRVQVTPEIQVGPTFQVIFDPVSNPEEDTVYVWGIRTRIEL